MTSRRTSPPVIGPVRGPVRRPEVTGPVTVPVRSPAVTVPVRSPAVTGRSRNPPVPVPGRSTWCGRRAGGRTSAGRLANWGTAPTHQGLELLLEKSQLCFHQTLFGAGTRLLHVGRWLPRDGRARSWAARPVKSPSGFLTLAVVAGGVGTSFVEARPVFLGPGSANPTWIVRRARATSCAQTVLIPGRHEVGAVVTLTSFLARGRFQRSRSLVRLVLVFLGTFHGDETRFSRMNEVGLLLNSRRESAVDLCSERG